MSFWRRLKALYLFLLPVRFSVLAVFVLIYAFFFSDQGRDALQTIVEYTPTVKQAPRAHEAGFSARFALTVLFAWLAALEIWYWARQALRVKPNAAAGRPSLVVRPDPITFERAARYVPRWLGGSVFVILIGGFLRVAIPRQDSQPVSAWVMVGILAASLGGFIAYVRIRRRRLDATPDNEQSITIQKTDFRSFEKDVRVSFQLNLVLHGILLILSWLVPWEFWWIGTTAVLLLGIAVWVPLGTFLVLAGERLEFPIIGALVVWTFIVSPFADNHSVRTLGAPERVAARVNLNDAIQRWYAASPRTPRVPMFIVATEGGGIRAAYWTAVVLTSLQDQIPTFSSQLFAISGVSGGAVGATVFDALLARRLMKGRDPSTFGGVTDPDLTFHGEAQAVLRFDALSGTLASLSQADFAQRFLFFRIFHDRAFALERGWESGWSSAWGKDDQTRNLFTSGFLETMNRCPQLPALFLNGTMVETGDRIITSNVRVRSAPEFSGAFDGFELLQSDLRFSTAAHMSARFPYLSPAGTLKSDSGPAGHVVDGGYFENSGTLTASEIIAAVRRTNLDIEPILILIDSGSAIQDRATVLPFPPFRDSTGPARDGSTHFANEMLSPLRTLLAARNAHAAETLADTRFEMPDHGIEFRLDGRGVPLPLGWLLSDRSRTAIDNSIACEGGNLFAARQVAAIAGGKFTSADPVAMSAKPEMTEAPPAGCR